MNSPNNDLTGLPCYCR